MSKEWKEVQLGDCCVSDYSDESIPIENINIHNYLSTDNMLQNLGGVIPSKGLPSTKTVKHFKKNDVLFSNIRTYFRKVWLANIDGGCSNDILVFRSKKVDAKFLYYVLADTRFIEYTDATSKGTKMPRGDKEAIKKYILNLPPLEEQKAIAHILGKLDDKIELNRQMNQTLEDMAQALFQSWFVDFDPVHAKAALKHSTLEGESENQGRSPQMIRWGEIKRQYTQQAQTYSKALRQNLTNAERLLWHYLRNKQLDGYKFRRQQAMGNYIVDFVCLSKKIIIELDGGQHQEQQSYDSQRDNFLQQQGYKVLRFWNNDVFNNCFGVLEKIYAELVGTNSPLEGESESASATRHDAVGGQSCFPPPTGSSAGCALDSPTPPQGGSGWTAERAKSYLATLPKGIADLFPDTFTYNQTLNKHIPTGWEVRKAETIADISIGKTPPRKETVYFEEENSNSNFTWVSIKNMGNCGVFISNSSEYLTEKAVSKFNVKKVPSNTVLLSFKLTIGRVAITTKEMCTNEAIAHFVNPKLSLTSSYLFNYLNKFDYENLGSTSSIATAINSKLIKAMPILIPSEKILNEFKSLSSSLFNKIKRTQKQTETLTKLRDTLLPQLISGKLKVPEALLKTQTNGQAINT